MTDPLYTITMDVAKHPGLLFNTWDISKIEQDLNLRTIFPNGFFIRTVSTGPRYPHWNYNPRPDEAREKQRVIVTAGLLKMEPDKATPEDIPIIFIDGKGEKHVISLRARYNQCLSLFKAVGCRNCPMLGKPCLSEQVGHEIEAGKGPYEHDCDALLEFLTKQPIALAGHDFVLPTRTSTKAFSATFRASNEHDFDLIKENAKRNSQRSTDAAVTRKFKKEQCSKCIIADRCNSGSHCRGRYPDEAEIVERCNNELDEILSKSPWPEWQLWQIARGAGNTAKVGRRNIILTGLKLQGTDGLVPQVYRSKTYIERVGALKTYEEHAAAFDLMLTLKEVKAEEKRKGATFAVPNRSLRAAWWLLLKSGNVSKKVGWGYGHSLIGCGIDYNAVSLIWGGPTYIESYGGSLHCVADVANLTYGRLGHIEKIESRPSKYGY